jgi:pyruvate/2-oxoglutarate dehydrogenase complex dihydrolipoamide acyltransferase (E2) component
MSPLRRTVSRRMLESWTSIPKINQFADADITALLALRKKYAPAYEKNGTHLTLTSALCPPLYLRSHDLPRRLPVPVSAPPDTVATTA